MRYIMTTLLILFLSLPVFAETGNGKNYGIAVNPSMAMFRVISGELNIWNLYRGAEINIPFVLAYKPDLFDNNESSLYILGTKYRHFLSDGQSGFFGEVGYGFIFGDGNGNTYGNTLLFGIGYRLLYSNGFFWGSSLSMGRVWFVKEEDQIGFDVDFFKVGYCW